MESFVPRYRYLAFFVLTALVLVGSVAMLLPFVPALLWATVLSVLMYPIHRRFLKRFERLRLLKGDRAGSVASFSTVVATMLIVLIPLALIGLGLFAQVGGVSTNLAGEAGKPSFEKTLESVDDALKPLMDSVGGTFSVKEYVLEHQQEIVQGLRTPVVKFASQAGFTILTLVIALLTMFFMLRDGERLRKPALDLIPLPHEKTNEILAKVADTIRAVFIGTVLVALIQGLVMGIGYWIGGAPSSLMLAVATAVLAVIPLLGPPVVYIPVGAMLFLQGKTTGALVVLGFGFLIASQIDNLLKPLFIGGRTNLHPLAIFFSILGGVLMIGPIGIMAGPMLLTILLALIEVIRAWMGNAESATGTQ